LSNNDASLDSFTQANLVSHNDPSKEWGLKRKQSGVNLMGFWLNLGVK
jgi:hypothetical protein